MNIKEEINKPINWIAVLRILVGLMFLTTWLSNVTKGLYTPDGLVDFFTNSFPQSENPLTWYALFINNVILPIRNIFAPFQLVMEFVLGLALLTGAFTRFFSLAGIFFLLNTFLATFSHDWPWAYLLPISILGVVWIMKAGRVWGVDHWLVQKFGDKGLKSWFW